MTPADIDVREEVFENIPTGVEAELSSDDQASIGQSERPANIRVSTKQFSLRNVLDLIKEDSLELAPDFQRNRVWKARQKSRLIESILLQIPLPAFYFAEDSDGMMRVVDGLQRLSTIRDYVRGPDFFGLADLEYLKDLAGRKFVDLPAAHQRRINNAQIMVHVIDPTTPPRVTYDIFKRINTGGTPLNAQEIRHCMSRDRSRAYLKQCAVTPELHQATGGVLRDHIRMDDRELALRFTAFRLHGVAGYLKKGSMDTFLAKTTEMLDDRNEVSDERLKSLYEEFQSAMTAAYEIFGTHSFRKWPSSTEKRYPINRPLFECWSISLYEFTLGDLKTRKDAIVKAARSLMSNDQKYIDAITLATGSPTGVEYRFERTEEAARAGR